MPAKNSHDPRAELKELDRQIAERKRYLRDQERVINETIETGNGKIMELRHEVLVLTGERKQLKTDIRLARRDRKLLDDELTDLRKGISEMLQPNLANAAG